MAFNKPGTNKFQVDRSDLISSNSWIKEYDLHIDARLLGLGIL